MMEKYTEVTRAAIESLWYFRAGNDIDISPGSEDQQFGRVERTRNGLFEDFLTW
jgi:hypothetical protein